jgi:phosphoribosylformylglycinamidine cyclo-ligase
LIQEQSKTDWKEMYQVFNCGHRMEIYVPEAVARIYFFQNRSMSMLKSGRVEAAIYKKLTISSKYGTLNINIIRS